MNLPFQNRLNQPLKAERIDSNVVESLKKETDAFDNLVSLREECESVDKEKDPKIINRKYNLCIISLRLKLRGLKEIAKKTNLSKEQIKYATHLETSLKNARNAKTTEQKRAVVKNQILEEIDSKYQEGIQNATNLHYGLNAHDSRVTEENKKTGNWLKKEQADVNAFAAEGKGFSPLSLMEKIPRSVRSALAAFTLQFANGASIADNIQKTYSKSDNTVLVSNVNNNSSIDLDSLANQINNQGLTGEVKINGNAYVLDEIQGNTTAADLEVLLNAEEKVSGGLGSDNIFGGEGHDSLEQGFVNLELASQTQESLDTRESKKGVYTHQPLSTQESHQYLQQPQYNPQISIDGENAEEQIDKQKIEEKRGIINFLIEKYESKLINLQRRLEKINEKSLSLEQLERKQEIKGLLDNIGSQLKTVKQHSASNSLDILNFYATEDSGIFSGINDFLVSANSQITELEKSLEYQPATEDYSKNLKSSQGTEVAQLPTLLVQAPVTQTPAQPPRQQMSLDQLKKYLNIPAQNGQSEVEAFSGEVNFENGKLTINGEELKVGAVVTPNTFEQIRQVTGILGLVGGGLDRKGNIILTDATFLQLSGRQSALLPDTRENLRSLELLQLTNIESKGKIEDLVEDLSIRGASPEIISQLRQYLLSRYNAEQSLKQAQETGDFSRLRLRAEAVKNLTLSIQERQEREGRELSVEEKRQIIKNFVQANPSVVLPDLDKPLFLGFLNEKGLEIYNQQVGSGVDPAEAWKKLLSKSKSGEVVFKTEEEAREAYLDSTHQSTQTIQNLFLSTYGMGISDVGSNGRINSGNEINTNISASFNNHNVSKDRITGEIDGNSNVYFSASAFISPKNENRLVAGINENNDPFLIQTGRTFGLGVNNYGPTKTNTQIESLLINPTAYRLIAAAAFIPNYSPSGGSFADNTIETNLLAITNPGQSGTATVNGQPVTLNLSTDPTKSSWIQGFASSRTDFLRTFDPTTGEITIDPNGLDNGVSRGLFNQVQDIHDFKELSPNSQFLLFNGRNMSSLGRLGTMLGLEPGTTKINPFNTSATAIFFDPKTPGTVVNTEDNTERFMGISLNITNASQALQRTVVSDEEAKLKKSADPTFPNDKIEVERFNTQTGINIETNFGAKDNLILNIPNLIGAAADLSPYGDDLRRKQAEMLEPSRDLASVSGNNSLVGLSDNIGTTYFRKLNGELDITGTLRSEQILSTAFSLLENGDTKNVAYSAGFVTRPDLQNNIHAEASQFYFGSTPTPIFGTWSETNPTGDTRLFVIPNEAGAFHGGTGNVAIQTKIDGEPVSTVTTHTPFVSLHQNNILGITPLKTEGETISGVIPVPVLGYSHAQVWNNKNNPTLAKHYWYANTGVSLNLTAGSVPGLTRKPDYMMGGQNLINVFAELGGKATLAESPAARTEIYGRAKVHTEANPLQSNIFTASVRQSFELDKDKNTTLSIIPSMKYTPQEYFDFTSSIYANLGLDQRSKNRTNLRLGLESPGGISAQISHSTPKLDAALFYRNWGNVPTLERINPSGHALGGLLNWRLNEKGDNHIQLQGGFQTDYGSGNESMSPFFDLRLNLETN